MKIHRIDVRNFRLLHDVSVHLEDRTTLIVGRNNSGKTSLTELFNRLLSHKSPGFRFEDFSLASHEKFWLAVELYRAGKNEDEIRKILPAIEVDLIIEYDVSSGDLGVLGGCIVDLDPNCTQAKVAISFAPGDGKIKSIFEGMKTPHGGIEQDKLACFKIFKDQISKCYTTVIHAVDPNDSSNHREIDKTLLSNLVQSDFIYAQRGLDDTTSKDRDVLGKVLEVLFSSASADAADPKERTTAQDLATAVERIQQELQDGFNSKLTELLPAFSLFGYPGLSDPGLVTETTLDVERLLTNHTKVRYSGINGISLPETYNGLGARNLVFILLQLLSFFRAFKAKSPTSGIHLIFIEEPEAHLHPQMQEVFIRQIEQISTEFEKQLNHNQPWPVQFVVSTHSSHMANEARFESIRYFISSSMAGADGIRTTRVRDLRKGLGNKPLPDRDFIHQYLTLTRCDLFFADKAILVEGTSERLLLPKIIEKIDSEGSNANLGSQFVTVMEVGGAYAHRFFPLLDFLELPTLVITDLDAVTEGGGEACMVSKGTRTSNGCIKEWFEAEITPEALIKKEAKDKTKGIMRLAFQVPETKNGICGRSFEDAFILANTKKFSLEKQKGSELEQAAWDLAKKQKKSEFAIRFAIDDGEWSVPLYMAEGLRWLAETPICPQREPTSTLECETQIEDSELKVN